MSTEEIATRINGDGSEQRVSWVELHLGDVVLRDDGKRVRLVTTEPMELQRLASGVFQMRGGGDKWYVATTYMGDTLYAPVEPADSPFGHRSAQWIIPLPNTMIKALTFQEVSDS